MIDRRALLDELKPLVTRLIDDLRAQADTEPAIAERLALEHGVAVQAGRTAMALEDWREDELTQGAAAWVLACVFVRFLEDNGLIADPLLSGAGARRDAALGRRAMFFEQHPTLSDREYLLLEKVYRRLAERLSTADAPEGALRTVLERWSFALEEDVLATGTSESELDAQVGELMEARLRAVADRSPSFAIALRRHREARARGDDALADGILAWLGAQPNVPAAVRRAAGVRGEIDHFGALGHLQGLLTVLRDAGHPGLLLVLDEVETLQRVRGDVREKALNALRQLVDEIDAGRFPGLMLVITGTPAFFDGPQGVQRLAPLAQRLQVDFGDPRFDNPRAPQIRLPAFDGERLVAVGTRVRDIYLTGADAPTRIRELVDDAYVAELAVAVGGELGGHTGIAPRVFLRKLVGDVLDRLDQFPDFRPREHYALTLSDSELTLEEREARHPLRPDDVELD